MDSVRLNCSTNSFITKIIKALTQSGNKRSSLGIKQQEQFLIRMLKSNCYGLPKVLLLIADPCERPQGFQSIAYP